MAGVVLADLIALGKIGIIVLLAVPLGEWSDVAIEGDRRLTASSNAWAVEDGE